MKDSNSCLWFEPKTCGYYTTNDVADAENKLAKQTKQIDYPPYEEAEDCSAYDGEARLSNGDIL